MFGLIRKSSVNKQLDFIKNELAKKEIIVHKRIEDLIKHNVLNEKTIEKLIKHVLSDMIKGNSPSQKANMYLECFDSFRNMINTRIDEHAHKFLTDVVSKIVNPESFIDAVVERINKKKIL